MKPKDKSVFHKLFQGAEVEIEVLKKKRKLPFVEHVMALEVARVEKETYILNNELLKRNDYISNLKEMNYFL